MKYHVKWIETPRPDHVWFTPKVGKEVVEKLNLGAFIMGLVNDGHVIIQCEPI